MPKDSFREAVKNTWPRMPQDASVRRSPYKAMSYFGG